MRIYAITTTNVETKNEINENAEPYFASLGIKKTDATAIAIPSIKATAPTRFQNLYLSNSK
jgi:hypothetical protein